MNTWSFKRMNEAWIGEVKMIKRITHTSRSLCANIWVNMNWYDNIKWTNNLILNLSCPIFVKIMRDSKKSRIGIKMMICQLAYMITNLSFKWLHGWGWNMEKSKFGHDFTGLIWLFGPGFGLLEAGSVGLRPRF